MMKIPCSLLIKDCAAILEDHRIRPCVSIVINGTTIEAIDDTDEILKRYQASAVSYTHLDVYKRQAAHKRFILRSLLHDRNRVLAKQGYQLMNFIKGKPHALPHFNAPHIAMTLTVEEILPVHLFWYKQPQLNVISHR